MKLTSPITSSQIRAARALLGWSGSRLAQESGVHVVTVSRLENGANVQPLHTGAIRAALEKGGVDFLPHEGVALVVPK